MTLKMDELQALIDKITTPKVQTEITQGKASARVQFIASLAKLFAISVQKASVRKHKAGDQEQVRQKWFVISASLGQILARLVRDLEYEKLRLDVDQLKRQVLERNVPSAGSTLHQPQHGTDQKEPRQQ